MKQLCAATHESGSGTNRTCRGDLTMSVYRAIVLQNSKVAAVKILGENLKRKEVDDSHSFSRATKSSMNLAQGDEVPRIITRRTRQRPSEFLTLPANDFCNTIRARPEVVGGWLKWSF